MEWRKLKNIILLMLVGLNLSLAVLLLGPRLGDRYRVIQAEREALTFLEKKGIALDEDMVPDPAALPPQVVERDLEAEARMAAQLLGETVTVTTSGGGVYRYAAEAGVLQAHGDGTFWARLRSTDFPLTGEGKSDALSVLEKLGFAGEVAEETEQSLTICQIWNGVPLFNQRSTVLWDDVGVTEIADGRRLHGIPVEDTERPVITRATALIRFYHELNRMGDVCSRVDEIVPGYICATALDRQMTLTPVWRITTDTGAYQLDLVNGVLDRVREG